MNDRAPKGHERWLLLGAFLVALGALTAIVLEDYEPVRLAPVFVLLAWFPRIAWHELGHAFAARLVGAQVEEIVIGWGTDAFSFVAFGVPITVKMYPIGGHVRSAPTRLAGARWRSALVYAAGPGAEVLALAALAAAVGPETLLTKTESIPVIIAQGVSIALVLGAAFNLVPRRISTPRGSQMTDGLGVFASLFRSSDDWRTQVKATHEASIRAATDQASALRRCEAAYQELGDEPHLRATMIAELERHHADVAGRDLPPKVLARLSRR